MKFLKVLGYIIFFGCGAYLFVTSIMFYYALWGLWGAIGSFIIFPLVEIFPIVAWIVMKQFPTLLFIIWGIGWVGMILAGIGKSRGETYNNEEVMAIQVKKEKFRGLSITALITGILSLIPNLLFAPLENLFGPNNIYSYFMGFLQFGFILTAILCGSIDLKKIKKGLYNKRGKGLDISGIVLGSLNFLWQALLILLLLLSL